MFFYVKIKIKNVFRVIELDEDEQLDIITLIERGLAAHDIDCSEIDVNEEFDAFDEHRMPITEENCKIIKQYKGCSHFYIEIDANISRKKTSMVTESLRNFLYTKDYDFIIEEHNRLHCLMPKTRRKLMDKLVEFIHQEYTESPKKEDLICVCQATIAIFPSLKADRSEIGGIDLLYNVEKKSGFLFNALRYRNRKRKNDQELDLTITEMDLTEEQANEIKIFFKQCNLPRDKQLIEAKLLETKHFRREMILNNFNEYKDIWDFCFVLPDLILYDFEIMFKNAKPNGLLELWPVIQSDPYNIFNIRIDKTKYTIAKKDPSIHNFLVFVKLIPTPRVSFDRALKALFIYSEDPSTDPVRLIDQSRSKPYIIVIFSQLEKTAKYYIDLEKRLVCLPTQYDFIQAVDIFIKIHKLFNRKIDALLGIFYIWYKRIKTFFDCSHGRNCSKDAKQNQYKLKNVDTNYVY